MITLFSAGEGFGLPEYSPYGMKTEVQLQLADLPYVKVSAPPQGSPKGQLPWIEDEGELIADSTFIRAHIEGKYGVDIDAGLTLEQRAVAWAFERMVENHLGWASACARFLIPENFEKGPGRWFDAAPEPMRETMRSGLMQAVRTNLTAVGILRHSDEEILWLAERSLTAIAVQLGDKPFLYGDRPAGSEAVVYSMLAGILTPFFDSPLRRKAEAMPSLVAYVGRMNQRFYPDQGAMAA
ncbi:glutathione S-transferase family protein [Caulobacter sp. SLTY]|uniref:glutathione S-transferase family protein n=1 Tax=Caulobacter sp. SLTY TaxID=2683262 RepID=UPI001412AAD5|nr:glutathione S-transferase family protein [Caulobacter sp. SLTY]NBB14341.1 glutathione S-transferase family protein [Caulobacter sp. SLTY]